MLRTAVLGAGALATIGLALAATPTTQEPTQGETAPEFGGGTWFNNIGMEPELASLRGRAVLLEFWATW